jgi:hypothetical protein
VVGSRPVLVVVCVLAWTGVACSGGGGGRGASSSRSVPTASASTLGAHATATTTVEVAHAGAAVRSWTAQHGGGFLDLPAASSRFDSQVAVIDRRVYTAYVDGTLIESEPDGAVIRQRKVPGIATTTVAAGRLFVAGTATSATRAFVELVDATTLQTVWRAEWPDVPADASSYHGITRPIVSAGTDVLWVGVGSVLERRQIATGRLITSVVTGAQGAAPAVAPDDSTLYTLAPQTTPPHIVLQRRNPQTGAVLVASPGPVSVALFPEMVPVSTGVWIAYRTGSLGTATLYARTDLHRITGLPGLPNDSQGPEFGMGVEIASSNTNLWVAGINFLACANPSSGAWRHVINGPASSDGANSVGLVGIDDGRVVADLGTGLGSFDEHASCPGSR